MDVRSTQIAIRNRQSRVQRTNQINNRCLSQDGNPNLGGQEPMIDRLTQNLGHSFERRSDR